ncbi:MAG: TetR/AcrR family transcriptional regulator [Spirochaetales bacterium]|nr:TetR/AcrR family transcriptional regulator [Spirochaetales bacterium]
MGRPNHSDIKRSEIVQYVYKAIQDHGIEGATLSTIASYMDGHKSLLTYYFNTKEELFIALVDWCIEEYEKFYFESIKDITDYRERYEKSIELIFSRQWHENINVKVFYSCLYLSMYNPKIKIRFKDMYRRFLESLESELTLYKEKGLINIDDISGTASYILAIVEGFDQLWITMEDSHDFEKSSKLFQQQVRTMLEG